MKSKKAFLITSLFLLALLLIDRFYYENFSIYNCDIITSDEVSDIIKNKNKMYDDISILYNGYIVPTAKMDDGNLIYILPQGNRIDYKGSLQADGYNLAIVKPKLSKLKLMEKNESIEIIAYSKDYYKIIDIFLTNLPVINLKPISYEYDIYRDGTEYEIVTGKMQIINPNGNESNNAYEVHECLAKYHIRGSSSRGYPKHSYKLNLIDEFGKKDNEKLLEMRNDNDWILNAMYLDESKVREKVSFDLWNYMNQNTKHNSKYVELIIDEKYRGLYLLQEPVDNKTFGIKKENSIIYSTKNNMINHAVLFSDSVLEYLYKNIIVDEFEIKVYDYNQCKEAIKLLRCIVKDLESNKNNINIEYDVNNFVDYQLFINMIAAVDNSYKNQIFVIKTRNNNNYFEKTVWDLDISMLKNTYEEHNVNEIMVDNLIPAKIKNSSEYKRKLVESYSKYRKKFYNIDIIMSILDTHFSTIENGGAILRDIERWNNDEYFETKEMLYDFFDKRIKVLDEYYDYGG